MDVRNFEKNLIRKRFYWKQNK